MRRAPRLDCVLVMPVFNEAATIATNVLNWIAEFRAYFEDFFRIVIVNDGSTDETGAILDQLAMGNPELSIIHLKRHGHGQAILAGYRIALALKPQYVFQTDSDGRHAPADFRLIWESRRYSRFILGDRQLTKRSGFRLWLSLLLARRGLALFGGRHIPDPNIPFRLMEAGYLESLLQHLPHQFLAPNFLLSVLADKQGADLVNIPVSYRERPVATWRGVHLQMTWLAIKSFFQLLAFRIRTPVPALATTASGPS